MLRIWSPPGVGLHKNMWTFESEARKNGYSRIAGIDEAGRGPLAGPVVAAAVILPETISIQNIKDSKKLTPKIRSGLYGRIYDQAVSVGVGIVGPAGIDRINILQASLLAMALSIENLSVHPDYVLIDGPYQASITLPQRAIPKGDTKSISIAAASIIAKVTRDRIMQKYHDLYPHYGFSKHKGYPTKAHKQAIQKYGYSPIHRKSFTPKFSCADAYNEA